MRESNCQAVWPVVDWLLERDNPSVRYWALRHLVPRSEDDPEVRATRAAIPQSAPVRGILARQAAGGYWGDPASPYQPKYRSTYWTLMLLGYLGLERSEQQIKRAVEYVFAFQQPGGGFAECGQQWARHEYSYVVQKCIAKGSALPDEGAFLADLVHQMTLSCLTGNVVAALLRLGYEDDARVWRAVEWLVQVQRSDGGWLCPYWRAHLRDKHSCFYGTICALEALAETPKARRSSSVKEAIARAAEFLLMHRLYRADHHQWRTINPNWLRLAFPWFYGYSILRGLWMLARLGYRDERMADALAVLEQKQTDDGRWLLESTPQGRMQADLEEKGKPSKWVTLIALWTLREWAQS